MKVTPIAVSLTRLSAIATRRKSMFGAPKSSGDGGRHDRDHAAIRQGQAGGGVALVGAVHGGRHCRPDPRQDSRRCRQSPCSG